jgi:hypothetical protein
MGRQLARRTAEISVVLPPGFGLLRVKSDGLTGPRRLPVYPGERTEKTDMSQRCQKPTLTRASDITGLGQ